MNIHFCHFCFYGTTDIEVTYQIGNSIHKLWLTISLNGSYKSEIFPWRHIQQENHCSFLHNQVLYCTSSNSGALPSGNGRLAVHSEVGVSLLLQKTFHNVQHRGELTEQQHTVSLESESRFSLLPRDIMLTITMHNLTWLLFSLVPRPSRPVFVACK